MNDVEMLAILGDVDKSNVTYREFSNIEETCVPHMELSLADSTIFIEFAYRLPIEKLKAMIWYYDNIARLEQGNGS